MISNFALLLSQEGIKLAHRTPDGWAELGQVNLLDDQLAEKLQALREKGEALAVKEFSTKIVLPNDQIKYLTLPSVDDDDREATIKDALEKTTPYLLDELVYDWEDGEDGMNVAAVSRDTLSEAESFVVQYGFNPINFVAAPDDALFSVEPFFGTCANVAADVDVSDNIEAEVDKVILTISDEAPMAEAVDDLPTDIDEGSTEEPSPKPEDTAADIEATEETDDPSDEDDEKSSGFTIAPLVAYRDDDMSHVKFPSMKPTTETSILRGMEPAIKPAPRIGMNAEEDKDVLDRSFPSWAGSATNEDTSADDAVDTAKIGWLSSKSVTADEDTIQPPSWMTTDDEATSDPEPEPEYEEDQEAAAWVPATEAAAIKQPLYDEVETEAERLEIFGNRGDQKERSAIWSPMRISVIALILILLIAASYFGFRYISSPSDPQIAAPIEAEETADTPATVEAEVEAGAEPESDPEQAPVEIVEDAPQQDVVEEILEPTIEATTALDLATETPSSTDEDVTIAGSDDLTAHQGVEAPPETLELPEDEIALETGDLAAPPAQEPVAQDQILTEAPTAAEMAPERPASDTETETETTEQAVADTAEEQVQPSDLLEGSASDWSNLSAEARDARYAATGIWPLAPQSPAAPVSESVGALLQPVSDPVVFATDAFAITAEAEMLSDKALTAVPNPPAAGTRFERDDRGLVLATPEGALTPDGITVYEGIPPVLPPLAPRPDPVAQQQAQRSELEGKIPQLRPELAVPAEVEEAAAAETAGATVNRLPPLRPAAIAALAAEPEAPVNPLALNQTPMPRLRPTNIGEIIYNTERASIAAQTTTAVAPSNATVGTRATEEDAISLRGVNLIGIYGEAGDRRALVRLQSGRYTKIEVGDRLNGGRVTAIDKDRVLYNRNGQTVVLRMPSN